MTFRRLPVGLALGGLLAVLLLGACSSSAAESTDEAVSESSPAASAVATQEVTPTQEATPTEVATAAPTATEEAAAELRPFGNETVADFFAGKCAACHGAERQGIVGPALLPERLTESDSFYFETIRDGRPGTAMPSWGAQGVTDDQINALVEFIKS